MDKFIGRREELASLKELYDRKGFQMAVLFGRRRVGKTTLLNRFIETNKCKAVSFVRSWLDYIQIAEYPQAPEQSIERLIFEDDIPKRERAADTIEKVRYIPAPIIQQMDACIGQIEPAEMRPVYVLLRETGWRGTDVLNLRDKL